MRDCGRDRDAPVILRPLQDAGEVLVEEQIVQLRIALVRFLDPVQKLRANNATAAPDRGDVAEVQVPMRTDAGRAEQFHSLRVGNNLRSVKRVAHRRDQLIPIAGEFRHLRLRQNFRSRDAFVLARGDHARFDGRVDG